MAGWVVGWPIRAAVVGVAGVVLGCYAGVASARPNDNIMVFEHSGTIERWSVPAGVERITVGHGGDGGGASYPLQPGGGHDGLDGRDGLDGADACAGGGSGALAPMMLALVVLVCVSRHRRWPGRVATMARYAALAALCACAGSTQPAPPPEPAIRSPLLQQFADEAERLRPQFTASPLVQRFLDQAQHLAPRVARHVVVDGKPKDVDEELYYAARWGTPIAYARVLALVDAAGGKTGPGARWLDFGFGAPGHLQMLAATGLDVTGVEVDPLGAAIYNDPSDVAVPRGKLALRFGRWPAEAEVKAAVGGGFDVIMSKNVLKHGYIHPAREVDPKRLVHLGVDDAGFLAAVHDALAPGGLFAIWNLCPGKAPPDKPYLPYADGESPFTREQFEAAGFEVLQIDVDEQGPARAMARTLRFDAPDADGSFWDLDHDLGAWFTLVRRK